MMIAMTMTMKKRKKKKKTLHGARRLPHQKQGPFGGVEKWGNYSTTTPPYQACDAVSPTRFQD